MADNDYTPSKSSLQQAATGFYPHMKGKRSKQNPEAAKNMPVSALRGVVAGTLGAPGDIEALARLFPPLRGENILPTSESIEERLPFRSTDPANRAAAGVGSLVGSAYTGPGAPIRAVGALPRAIQHGAEEFAHASAAAAPRMAGDMSRRSFLQGLSALMAASTLPASSVITPAKAAQKALGPVVQPTAEQVLLAKTNAQNFLAHSANINNLVDPRSKAELIAKSIVPEGMSLKQFMRALKSDPASYDILQSDLNRLGNEFRYTSHNPGVSREKFLNDLDYQGLPIGTIRKELKIWDKTQGNFPEPKFLPENIKPRLFDPDMGNPAWMQQLPLKDSVVLSRHLLGTPYKESQAKLANVGKFLKTHKLENLDDVNVESLLNAPAGAIDPAQHAASPVLQRNLMLRAMYNRLKNHVSEAGKKQLREVRQELIKLGKQDPVIADIEKELSQLKEDLNIWNWSHQFKSKQVPDYVPNYAERDAYQAKQADLEARLQHAKTEFDEPKAAEPFWYNPENSSMAAFPEEGMHNKVIQDPEYAGKLGVSPEEALSPDSKLLMGRHRGKSLDLMQVSPASNESLSAVREMLEQGNLNPETVNFSAGENLFEGVPLDEMKKILELKDLEKYQKYAEGGTVKAPSEETKEKLRQLREMFVPLANEAERQKRIQYNLEKMNPQQRSSADTEEPDTVELYNGGVVKKKPSPKHLQMLRLSALRALRS